MGNRGDRSRHLPHPLREGIDAAGRGQVHRLLLRRSREGHHLPHPLPLPDRTRKAAGVRRELREPRRRADTPLRRGRAYTLLSNDEANRLSLLEEQRWRIYYEPEALQAVRKRADLDRFRAPGYFDDVSVILCSNDRELIPEGVWVRLEGQSDDGASLRGTLLNEPYSDFGVHEGEMVTVCFAEGEEGRILVAETGS